MFGQTTTFLGWTVEYDKIDKIDKIEVSQTSLIKKFVRKLNFQNYYARSTPQQNKPFLNDDSTSETLEKKKADISMYAFGYIRYVADETGFDISYADARIAQFINKPAMTHFKLLLHLVRCLHGTSKIYLTFNNQSNATLKCFSDSDYTEFLDRTQH